MIQKKDFKNIVAKRNLHINFLKTYEDVSFFSQVFYVNALRAMFLLQIFFY